MSKLLVAYDNEDQTSIKLNKNNFNDALQNNKMLIQGRIQRGRAPGARPP